MTSREKVAWLLFNCDPTCGTITLPWEGGCEYCPLRQDLEECYPGGGLTSDAKAWLFDHGFGYDDAVDIYHNWTEKNGDKKIKTAHLPDGCVQIYPPDYKHLMLVRVFVRNFKDSSLDEVSGLFVLSRSKDEGTWFIKANEKEISHGFRYDQTHGWHRTIFQNGQYLSDVIVIAVEEQKPNMAHMKNNYRKLKT